MEEPDTATLLRPDRSAEDAPGRQLGHLHESSERDDSYTCPIFQTYNDSSQLHIGTLCWRACPQHVSSLDFFRCLSNHILYNSKFSYYAFDWKTSDPEFGSPSLPQLD